MAGQMTFEQVKEMIEAAGETERNRHKGEMEVLKKQLEAAQEMSRKGAIEAETKKYRAPSDKKAIEFLFDEKYDLEMLQEDFTRLLGMEFVESNEAQQLALIDGKKAEIREMLCNMADHGNKRLRKTCKEIELYEIAANSKYGWTTVKFYRQSEMFRKTDSDVKWWDVEEMSEGDKTKKLRKAEKAAADYLESQKKEEASSGNSIKRSRFGPPVHSATGQEVNHFPAQLSVPPPWPQPPVETRQCHACKLPGHLQAACPYKKRN